MTTKTGVSIEELEMMLNEIKDPQEREGLKAFIENVAPKLVAENTGTFLGKIKSYFLELPEDATIEAALDRLKEDYHVTIE
ncbi:hypothetical protein [Bacillus thermotolerans]|uniref:hypothetical protein n=1 Tax=Bacillus thermotolerans TaxID=1221996 RepID=UPI00057D1384|nr:hypothetical protein [Bacillus thermotolerans]KKB34126.1 hypothetical protein QY97_02638 [Bacillus thermotolerans]